ncbi:MAG: LysM peptidoglycan-binding domain-containing protein [Candidatus Doudnabacteria bacterium]|nr:LysM peptidoglycan-binding domain-containing protein [Candidatus Doudnabacteria bacterium]
MWFGKNQKRIRLSRQLKWSVGRGRNNNRLFWSIGLCCLALSAFLISRTNALLQNEAAPQVLGASTEQGVTESDAIIFTDYKVMKGETLFTISQKFGLPTETVAQINDIRPPFNIKAGQIIKIPQ